MAVPPGWPRDLPPPSTGEFDERVGAWLLDRGPADLRASPLRTLPIALAAVVTRVVSAELEAIRGAYATARADLAEFCTPDQIATVQAALEAQGARLVAVDREVSLVADVLVQRARRRVRDPGIA